MGVYEDNFGFWDTDGPEEQALFEHVQRQSVYIKLRALRTFRPSHSAQNPLRHLRQRSGIRRTIFDERIWLQSDDATGNVCSCLKGNQLRPENATTTRTRS
jgi:hypothetical protein